MNNTKMLAIIASIMDKDEVVEKFQEAIDTYKSGDTERGWNELRMTSQILLTKNMIEGLGGPEKFIDEVEHKSHVLKMDDTLRSANISTSIPDTGPVGQN